MKEPIHHFAEDLAEVMNKYGAAISNRKINQNEIAGLLVLAAFSISDVTESETANRMEKNLFATVISWFRLTPERTNDIGKPFQQALNV